MGYRFQLGQDLYEHDNNKLVRVIKRYPLKKNDIPVYQIEFYDSDFKENKREYHLYENPDVFPNSKFRVGETVYFTTLRRPYKNIKHKIIDIYFDDYSKDIIYKCLSETNEERLFHAHQISCYPFSHPRR